MRIQQDGSPSWAVTARRHAQAEHDCRPVRVASQPATRRSYDLPYPTSVVSIILTAGLLVGMLTCPLEISEPPLHILVLGGNAAFRVRIRLLACAGIV